MKIWKKLCVSMLLLCMLLCVMSITVAADNTHTHPVCGATHTDIGDHTGSCAAVVWTAWDGTSDINYGESNTAYVYLSDNATRSSTLTVTGGNTLYLCLGGKTLTGDITVEGDATLNICDCRGGGEIKTASGNAVYVKTKHSSNVHTTLNLYGGKIGSNGTFNSGAIELYNNDRNNAQTVAVFNMYGGEVYNGGAGEAAVFASYANIGQGYYELNMYGGSIRCEKGNGFAFSNNENVTMQITGGTITSGNYGVNLSSNDKLTLSGNPQFIDKKYYSSSAGIYIPNGVTLTVTDDFAPAGGTTVSVGMFIDDATGTAVIATPVSGKSLSAKAQYFTSAVEGCFVECNADGNLYLTKCAITGQPTKGNRYTVSANGTPNYQWWSTKRGDISVTDERATADTFYYAEWREEWYYSTEASDGTAVTLKAFTLHMAAGDVLKLNSVRDIDSSYFYLTGVSITRSGGGSTPLTGTYDDYTFTAPADGEYTVEITAEWAVGSSSYYMNFSFTATVSGDVTDAELSGQTNKTLDTTALENGKYICAVTWGNTTLYSDVAEVHNHTWNDGEVTTAPTCTVAGVKTFTCTTCNETKTEPVDALGHDFAGGAWQSDGTNHWKKCSRCDVTEPKSAHTWNDGEVTTAPTCTVAGVKTFTCTECSATNVQTIDALGHDFTGAWQKDTDNHWKQCSHSGCTATDGKAAHRWAEQTILEATCTADGKKLCICKDCLAAKSETLPATGHTLTHHAEKAPTCTEIGWNAYDTCACGYTTYVELPALGHDRIHHNAKAVTCTENGWNAYETCSRCDYTTFAELPALGHDKVAHEGQAATCVNIGWEAYDTCSRCAYTTYAELPALGHTTIFHDAKAATCTEKGWRAYVTCEHCGYTTYVETPALGHDKIHHNAKAVTCTEKGWEAYETCSRCAYTTYAELPALGHTTISHEAKAVTCTEKGWEAYETCSRCSYTTFAELPALGHDKIAHEGQAATCINIGWNAYDTCSRCAYTTYAELPALGHTTISHDAKAPTCTEKGWRAYVTCEHCGYTTYAETPALGHTTISHDAKAPTCTEKGWRAYVTCEHCDYTTYAETPALGHDKMHHNAKAVTCTEKGWEAYETCSRCDYTTFAELPALGHDKIAHEGQAATCTEKGWNAYDTCSRCAYTTYAELPALGHDKIHHDAKAPTCTEKGWRAYVTCEHCGYTTYVELPALGHDFTGAWQKDDNNHWKQCSHCTATDGKAAHRQSAGDVLAKASCTADGQKIYICEDCFATKSETLSATGHTLTHHEARAATCTEKGWNAYDTCETCGYTTYAETPALGHDFGDAWKSDAAKHWKECSRCDAVAGRASHTGGTATCHDSAVCTVCATSYGERNPDYHTGGSEIRDMTAPTAEKAGHTGNRYCKGCNAKLSEGTGIPTLSDLSLDQKSDLTAATEAMEKILDDWYSDFTEEQKELLTDRIRATGSALASMEKAEEAVKKAEALPAADKTRPDDKSAMDAYDAAKNAYDALSDAEKELAGERTKSALDAMWKALTAYDVIDGNGSTWANTDNEGLTFTVNGHHEKFAGLLINGATVDAKYYVIQAGSTVITLKAEYLQTLSAGKYTVTVRYTDGSTDGEDSFTVTENKTVAPSDPAASSDPDAADGTATHRGVVVGIILAIICALLLLFLLLFFKKRRKEEK